MDPVTMTVFFKGIAMILAILGGVLAILFGYKLFDRGIGQNSDDAQFEFGKVKISVKSVGGVLMGTSFLWVYAGVLLSPNLEKTGEDYRIFSFQIAGIEALIPSFSMFVSADSPEDLLGNSELLAEYFSRGFENSSLAAHTLLNGESSTFFPGSVVVLTDDGDIRLATRLASDEAQALVYFETDYENGILTFIPANVEPAPE